MQNFSFEIFNNLFKRDPEKAIAYRDKHRNPEIVAKEKGIETPTEDTIEDTPLEITEDELKAKLKEAWVKFHHKSKSETLVKLCIENNLL